MNINLGLSLMYLDAWDIRFAYKPKHTRTTHKSLVFIFSSKKKALMGFSSENKNFIGISSLTKKKTRSHHHFDFDLV